MSQCGFFFTLLSSVHFLQNFEGGRVWAQETPPSPDLVQLSSGMSSHVVLQCRAPSGHGGRVFELYRLHTLVLSRTFEMKHSHADFQLSTDASDSELYCCRYDHSMYSPYTRLLPSPRPITPPIPPQLSVTPPDGYVWPGQVVKFHCLAPPTLTPVEFVLQKQRHQYGDTQMVLRSHNPQFRVGPVGVADGGMYTCFYMLNLPEGFQNSTPSTSVSLIVKDDLSTMSLPAPQLSQRAEGTLVCTGSPSYPGAYFSLFQKGSSSPLRSQHAHSNQNRVQFTASDHHEEVAEYQCQYSALLGNTWVYSELSSPITWRSVTGSIDLALVCGSVSAVLLFLMVLILLVAGIYKYAQTAAKKRRQREQEKFWQNVHSRDHVIDLTLQRISIGSKEERSGSESEHIYDVPLNTFTRPPAL